MNVCERGNDIDKTLKRFLSHSAHLLGQVHLPAPSPPSNNYAFVAGAAPAPVLTVHQKWDRK